MLVAENTRRKSHSPNSRPQDCVHQAKKGNCIKGISCEKDREKFISLSKKRVAVKGERRDAERDRGKNRKLGSFAKKMLFYPLPLLFFPAESPVFLCGERERDHHKRERDHRREREKSQVHHQSQQRGGGGGGGGDRGNTSFVRPTYLHFHSLSFPIYISPPEKKKWNFHHDRVITKSGISSYFFFSTPRPDIFTTSLSNNSFQEGGWGEEVQHQDSSEILACFFLVLPSSSKKKVFEIREIAVCPVFVSRHLCK